MAEIFGEFTADEEEEDQGPLRNMSSSKVQRLRPVVFTFF